MDTMYMTVSYLRMRARRLGRAVFGNDAGALTLEWIMIAVALFGAAIWAGAYIMGKVKADAKKIH